MKGSKRTDDLDIIIDVSPLLCFYCFLFLSLRRPNTFHSARQIHVMHILERVGEALSRTT